MATVYLAQDLKHDRPVALKVLHPELSSALGPERFLQEIKLTARLDHPHILPVLDSGDAGGRLWYSMPYVQGETLRDRLMREVQLPLEEAVRITSEVADALDYAHRHGVVHRDVKPENILLSEGHARVADFGVARALEAAGSEKLTATGLALGTPAYMAPEQASGDRVDRRTDVYAIGCVLYEMLSGEPPFMGPTPQAIVAKRFAGPPPSIRTTRPDVPAGVEAILTKALAQVAAARFGTAGELRQALEHAPFIPAVPSQGQARRARPDPVRLVGIAMIPLALIVVGIFLARARTGDTRNPAGTPKLLAVLPFESAGDTSERAFADGMSEEITSRLARMPGLSLVARSSALQYRRSGKSAPDFGRSLGVDYVLDGTVRSALGPTGQKQVRITPELIRVADGTRLWGEPYQRVLTDVFLLQADVAQQVAEVLRGKLGRSEERAVRTAPTMDPEAFRLYALGRGEWKRRTPESLERAADYFRQAIVRDSSFARAWAGLADAYALYDIYGVRSLPRDSAYARAKAAALRAIALDSTLAEPHASLNQILRYGYWDWAGSERAIRRAIALDPTYATAHQWLAEHLLNFGRLPEAIAEARSAVQFDPLAPAINNILGLTLQFAGRTDESVAVLRAAISRDSSAGLGPQTLFWTYLLAGRENEALALRAALRDTSMFWRAVGHARSDPRARAAVLDALRRPGGRDFVGGVLGRVGGPAWASRLYAYLGATDAALAELERAAAERDPTIEFLKVDPLWASVRGDPRFAVVVARMGLPP
jgi:TolB-like protein/tetratricopeptide (TPR) repeat protein